MRLGDASPNPNTLPDGIFRFLRGACFVRNMPPPVASFGIYIDVLGDFIGEVAIVRVFTV